MRVLTFVEIGNFFYFLFIFLLFGLVVGLTALCHKLGKRFSYRFISITLWANFALHFLKQFLPNYYKLWPYSLGDSLFPNLCAVLIFLSPFIFHWGNAHLKDYMYYIGIISGVLVYFVPTGALRTDVTGLEYAFETTRFYLCHWPLVVCGFLMVEQGFHKLDWKRLWSIPLTFGGILVLITLDQFLFGPILKFQGYPHEWIGENGVLNRFNPYSAMSNQSMQFGPQPGPDKFLSWLYPALIPGLAVYWVEGERYFTPVIWMLPFIALATPLVGIPMCLPFEHKQMKLDVLGLRQRKKLAAFHRHKGH